MLVKHTIISHCENTQSRPQKIHHTHKKLTKLHSTLGKYRPCLVSRDVLYTVNDLIRTTLKSQDQSIRYELVEMFYYLN